MLIRDPDAPDPWPLPEGPPAWLAWCLLIVGIGAAVVVALMVGVIVARADPPAGSDGKLAPWFRSLMQPGTGIGCCSEADCRQVEYRITGDHYEAFIKRGAGPEAFPLGTDQWVTIPAERVLRRVSNPTGQAVMCWLPSLGVLCFVEASGT